MSICHAESSVTSRNPLYFASFRCLRRTILAIFAASLLSVVTAYAVEPLSIDDAVSTALKNHPQITEAKANVKGAEARTGQSLASYYPQISLAADWSRGRSFMTASESIKDLEVHTDALYLKQTIYDFGRTSGTVATARSNRAAAEESLAITRQDLTFRVKASYYLVLAAEKQVAAVTETVKARETVFNQSQEFFRQGVRAKVDVARAEANLYAARTTLIRAGNNREIARIELANAMGVASLEQRPLIEPSSASPLILLESTKIRQDAVANRAELKRLSALKDAAAASLNTARSGYLPILSGVASVGYADKDFPPGGNVWGIGVNLTVPLFTGFSTVEQEREAVASLNAVEARQSDQRLQIEKDAETALLGVKEASARMESTDKEMTAGRESRSLAEGRYQEGVGSIIEVTDAQSQALDAETSHIQAVYDYHTALARLDRAIGKE